MSDVDSAPEAETEGPDEHAELAALYDKLTAKEPIEAEAEKATEAEPEEAESPADEPETGEDEAAEEAAEEVVPPTDVPAKLKPLWKDLPEAAREAVIATQREMSARLAEQGRVVQAAKPTFDALVEASKQFPELSHMSPVQIAKETFALASVRASLARNPVDTILGVAQHYGAIDALRAKLGNHQPEQAARANMELVRKVQALEAHIARLSDPQAIEQIVESKWTERDNARLVSDFASSAEHWSDVVGTLSDFIPIARKTLGEDAPPRAVLERAYDMAVNAMPDLRAKAQSAAAAPAASDPKKVQAQLKAKSVNVTPKSSGKPKPLSEREQMAAVWDKHYGT